MKSEFMEPSEELKRVAEEINLLRKDIQIASATLGRIEKRLKSAFPNYPTKKKEPKGIRKKENVSAKAPEELQLIFNDLVAFTQNKGDSGFALKVGELSDEDVIALAKEMGIASKSRLSRNKATDGLRKRVQEAMQLQFENRKGPQQQL
jgi:hypothetical protein